MLQNLPRSLQKVWRDANRAFRDGETYAVYAVRNGYCAFKIPPATRNVVIERTIARREENVPGRDYAGKLQPGSFNWRRVVSALDAGDAVQQAKALGLVHEPIKAILARANHQALPPIKPQDAAEIERLLHTVDRLAGQSAGTLAASAIRTPG